MVLVHVDLAPVRSALLRQVVDVSLTSRDQRSLSEQQRRGPRKIPRCQNRVIHLGLRAALHRAARLFCALVDPPLEKQVQGQPVPSAGAGFEQTPDVRAEGIQPQRRDRHEKRFATEFRSTIRSTAIITILGNDCSNRLLCRKRGGAKWIGARNATGA